MITGSMSYSRWVASKNTNSLDLTVRNENVSLSNALLIPGLDRLDPNKLFAQGQPGGWADPYDLTRMWQDDAGTTPMTLANLGTGIGRVITKGNAITLTQANAADRPVWGRHPVSGIVNLLERTEEFDNVYWVKTNTSVTANSTIAPDGTLTADTLLGTSPGSTNVTRNQDVQVNSTSVTVSLSIRAGTADTFAVIVQNSTTSTNLALASVEILSGPGGIAIAGAATANVTGLSTTAWTRIRVTTSAMTAGNNCRVFLYPETATSGSTTGKSVIVWGAMLNTGTTAGTYQRVTNRFDITEVGSPSLYYFDGNGVNQFMTSSANVNLSGTAKATIWSWVHKRSDTSNLVLLEQTIGTPYDSFIMVNRTGTRYGADIRDTSSLTVNTQLRPAPSTDSVVSIFDLTQIVEANKIRLWLNGTLSENAVTNPGPITRTTLLDRGLQMFRRSNGTLFFNGRCYGWILAGDTYDTRTIQRFDAWGLKPRRLITA